MINTPKFATVGENEIVNVDHIVTIEYHYRDPENPEIELLLSNGRIVTVAKEFNETFLRESGQCSK